MFGRLLVALDLSADAEKVFSSAMNLATSTGASLMLLHILSGDEEGAPIPMSAVPALDYYYHGTHEELLAGNRKQLEEYELSGLDMLRTRAAIAEQAGIEAEFSQQLGSAGRTICQVAKSWDADTIVMGRRGHSGLRELVLGSASSYVTHHAPCSVFILN